MTLTTLFNCVCLLERKPPVVELTGLPATPLDMRRSIFTTPFKIDLMGPALESSDSPASGSEPGSNNEGRRNLTAFAAHLSQKDA